MIELEAPLPGGRKKVKLHWVIPARFGRMQEVDRLQAEKAKVMWWDLDGKAHLEDWTLEEADRFLAEAKVLHDKKAAAKDRADAFVSDRAEVAATIDLTCQRCGVPRGYDGRSDLVVSHKPTELHRLDQNRAQLVPLAVHRYSCPKCGSLELFDGRLPHPLGVDA